MNNIHNKLLTKSCIENIVNNYLDKPIKVNKINLYQKAFTHKSFFVIDNENSDSDTYSVIKRDINCNGINSYNERLEFLGDKVIDFITTEYLFDTYNNKDEGFLTKLKSKMVNKTSLAKLANKLNFQNLLLISSHIERISGRNNNERLSEDIFESFMGAFYLEQDRNINTCREFLLNVYKMYIDFDELINVNNNFKDSLLRYFQSNAWPQPVYTTFTITETKSFISIVMLEKNTNCLHENIKNIQNKIINKLNNFKIEVSNLDKNYILGYGIEKTKKKAEQECSKDCLINLDISINY